MAAAAAARDSPPSDDTPSPFSRPVLGSEAVDPQAEWLCLESGEPILLLRGLLTATECQAVIDVSADMGMVAASPSVSARNCQRLLADDSELAAALWERCRSVICKSEQFSTLTVDKSEETDFGVLSSGVWKAERLNPRFRSCKYATGGHFAPHADGVVTISDSGERSFLTFMIYLDDVPAERLGATRFFRMPKDCIPDDPLLIRDDIGRMTGAETHVEAKVQPEAGMAIVFRQATVLHDGEPVSSGVKSILRSDILYKRVEGSSTAPTEEQVEGLKLHKLAADAEVAGDYSRAMKLYSRAYKLFPELEYTGGPT